jgi:hypothetical protein
VPKTQSLPWVEKDAIRPDTTRQRVTFGYHNEEDFNLDEVKEAIEGSTRFKVGKVLNQK